MSIETLVVLPEDLKAALDRRAPSPPERDELVAAALRAYFAWPRPGQDASDLAVINAHAVELNAEAEDALAYQVHVKRGELYLVQYPSYETEKAARVRCRLSGN